MKKIRTVIWDCDSVMWFHKKEEARIIANVLGITDVEEFEVEFFNMLNAFNKYFKKKKVTLGETYKVIEYYIPILFFYEISPKQFLDTFNEMKLSITLFNEDTLIVMENFKKKGIKQIIRSDWWQEAQLIMLKEYDILKYIEKLYCCDNRYLKCNPLSAKEIVKSGTEEENVIIGDSLSSDIAFANHAKIKSIWFNKDGEQKNDTQYTPDFEVKSLLEVTEIV